MKHRILSACGIIAPVLFVFTTILGGILRPGYSHISETVSELFSPGSPNKLLLDTLHTIYALLLVAFGIGLLGFVHKYKSSRLMGTLGASAFITMGLVSVTTATIFPQDAWGSPPTFPGEMHKILHGVISLLSILSMALFGMWFDRTGTQPGFGRYTYFSIGAVILTAGFFLIYWGSPIMGLTERIAGLAGFQWTIGLALVVSSR